MQLPVRLSTKMQAPNRLELSVSIDFDPARTNPDWRREVRALAAVSDGKIASGCWDNIIRLWDPLSGSEAGRLEGHTESVQSFAVLPDGRLASGAGDATIRLWNVTTLAETTRLETGIDNQVYEWDGTPTGYTRDSVTALVALPERLLASGYSDGTIRVWDLADNRLTIVIESGKGPVFALASLEDGRVASGSSGKEIRLWNPRTGADAGSLLGDAGHYTKFVTLPDGPLVSNARDDTIRIWNLNTGREDAILHSFAAALASTIDGKLVSAGGKVIQLWDVSTGCKLGHLVLNDVVTCLVTSKSGSIVAGDTLGRLHWLEVTS